MSGAYYNEVDKFAAAWLRELIKAGLIADGEVDERSIADVTAGDVRGFTQCHFFAGIGGWSYALRLAGWGDDRPVWTGSCPCQPWSMAGRGEGADDPRHLWPTWERLIDECRPPVVFGEQTASLDGLYWLDLVYAGLEARDYAVGAANLSGACFGSPDIRPRLWFVADTHGVEFQGLAHAGTEPLHGEVRGDAGGLALTHSAERRPRRAGRHGTADGRAHAEPTGRSVAGWLANAYGEGSQGRLSGGVPERPRQRFTGPRGASLLGGFWADCDWIFCRPEPRYPAGCWRPVERGAFPLAPRLPRELGRLCDPCAPSHPGEARIGRLRGYGNAIKPHVAAAFIDAYMSVRDIRRCDVATDVSTRTGGSTKQRPKQTQSERT